MNNIGYPKGEFDSDTDSDDILNDYENFDPTTSLQRVQSAFSVVLTASFKSKLGITIVTTTALTVS